MSFLAASFMTLAAPPVCDIRDHGAVSDDGAHDTAAIQSAVDACAGKGGMALIPAGDWSTGTMRLGSDMVLHLAEGAVLALHADIALFPAVEIARKADIAAARAALLADGVSGLRITGKGRIEGNSEAFWDEDFYASGLARPTLPRPAPVIELANCRNTNVEGINLANMPAFALRFYRCERVSARGIIDVTAQEGE